MKNSLYIAWKYISHNKIKTLTLIACVSIILILPISLEIILNESEVQLLSRADDTPLVVGAKGSALDLCMNTLYFDDEIPGLITMDASERIQNSGLALPVPVYIRFNVRSFPIIGTTIDYFDYRKLSLSEGRNMAVLGECVIGSSVAEALELAVGDFVISSPESLFDIAGVYPLKMKITGILQVSNTPDDFGIFTDLKTTWIIEGYGHGHQDVTKINDPTLIYERNDSVVAASSKLYHYNEITEANMDSFHFHGSLTDFPITAVLVAPNDSKSGTILQGQFLSKDEKYQIIQPSFVIDGLLQTIFRIRNVLDAIILIVGFSTFLAIILIFTLSLRLRQNEINTIFKIGCTKGTIVKLLSAEIALIIFASAGICFFFLSIISFYKDDLVRVLLLS